MIRWLTIFVVEFISLSSTNPSSFPLLFFDPFQFAKSDLLLYDFRRDFPRLPSYRCLLQTESKYVYLNSNCQLFTRTSLKSQCQWEHRIKLELVLPQNTTVVPIVLQSNRTDCPSNQSEPSCQFEKNPYRIKLRENEIYKNFLQLKAFSPCSPSNYLLSSTNARKNFDNFALNSSNGYLSLIQTLDYETNPMWKLVIQAEDKSQIPFYTYVIIDVDDVNDCPPLLSWNFPLQTIDIVNDTDSFQMEISIDEAKVQEKNVIIANLIASDLDSPLKFTLKINDSSAVPFRIDGPYGDSTYVLMTTERLDREEQDRYLLHLILSDSGKPRLSSSYRLMINLLDTNDHRPKFDQEIYYVDIQENNAINTTLLQVFANDSDFEENGRVRYAFDPPQRDDLWIDSKTGVIRTKIRFDYEQMTNFTFNVIAIDHPNKGSPLIGRTEVRVKIIDQNDHLPEFPQSSYEFFIDENNSPDSYLGQVQASDPDGTVLSYTLHQPSEEISSLFYVSLNDGKIYVLQSLDREQKDHYEFFLVASDGQHRSSPLPIHVVVRDLNDEIPRFLFPNEQNDTLVLDRQFWNFNDFICQIEIEDFDQFHNYSLLLIHQFEQLKNYQYLTEGNHRIEFHSNRFFLDSEHRLFFRAINGSVLDEGVYYIALKLIDGHSYFEEKLLKLIVVNGYDRLERVMEQYDYLGLHLNNRFAYLQYHHGKIYHRLSFDSSNKFLILSILAFATFILIALAGLCISLVKCRDWKRKSMIKAPSEPVLPSSPSRSNSSPLNLLVKPSNSDTKNSLRVTNCYDYNDTSLLMFNKDLMASTSPMNDHASLLEARSEKEHYDQQRNQIYSSWLSSTLTRTQRNPDSSTFQSFNHLAIAPARMHTQEQSMLASTSDYPIAIVSSSTAHPQTTHTPVSSDDGFCGSSDISDPSIPNGNTHLLTSYRAPYLAMKEGILSKTSQSPSFLSLSSTHPNESHRRVRFNLESERRKISSPDHFLDLGLKRFEQIYQTSNEDYDQPPLNSTIV